MPDGLTAPKAAHVLHISAATLKDWSARLGIGQRSSSTGAWVYTGDDLKVLQSFQSLREDGHGLDTITRKLRPLIDPEVVDDASAIADRPINDRSTYDETTSSELTLIRQEMVRVTDLARENAQAAHQIGDLEATVRHLQFQLSEREEQLKQSQGAISREARELEETRRRLTETQDRLVQMADRPWWRKLFGS